MPGGHSGCREGGKGWWKQTAGKASGAKSASSCGSQLPRNEDKAKTRASWKHCTDPSLKAEGVKARGAGKHGGEIKREPDLAANT